MESVDTDTSETRARILSTAESLLRRHGLDKLTVVDVARTLKMSHGNVYRHFPSKVALRATVIEHWLERIAEQTAAIADRDDPADVRLREWLTGLALVKQRKVVDDAEMLEAAAKIVKETPEVERIHSRQLSAQVIRILQDGMEDGTLPGVQDPHTTAATVLNATFRYHHPDLVVNGGPTEQQLEALSQIISLLLKGLGSTSFTQRVSVRQG